MKLYDVVIVGGGPAGLSAAYSAYRNGARQILVMERDREMGGILQQCIHNGFGLHHFKEELTGPGYAGRCIALIKDLPEIETMTDTMVLSVTKDKLVTAVNPEKGLFTVQGKTVILVTHNADIAKCADKVIRMKNGKIREIRINESPVPIREVEW